MYDRVEWDYNIKLKRYLKQNSEKTIADAIMDRLVHQAHRIELSGESMRKKKSIIKQSILTK